MVNCVQGETREKRGTIQDEDYNGYYELNYRL